MAAAGRLKPGATIGILGGGQLGRMLAMAAARLGLKALIFCDESHAPAFDVAAAHVVADYTDIKAIEAFARSVDVLTYEFENVPVAAALAAERICPVRPRPKALQVSQDRLAEKEFIAGLAIPVAAFVAIDSAEQLAGLLGGPRKRPGILKTRRLGYDGRGQVRLAPGADCRAAFADIAGAPAVLEDVIAFEREVSVIAVRGLTGKPRFYDLPENTHAGGILHRSVVPSGLPPAIIARAHEIAGRIAEALDYHGVLAVELFAMNAQAPEPLIVNEIAPRVHNSGHWTLDACATSQFENHIRAIAGWPLGSVERHCDAVMQNLIGDEVNGWPEILRASGACLHLYGKAESRPGRKMGHVTRLAPKS